MENCGALARVLEASSALAPSQIGTTRNQCNALKWAPKPHRKLAARSLAADLCQVCSVKCKRPVGQLDCALTTISWPAFGACCLELGVWSLASELCE